MAKKRKGSAPSKGSGKSSTSSSSSSSLSSTASKKEATKSKDKAKRQPVNTTTENNNKKRNNNNNNNNKKQQQKAEAPFPLYKDVAKADISEGFESIVNLLRGRKNIVVLTGAGISVSCGIPDFRSKGTICGMLMNLRIDRTSALDWTKPVCLIFFSVGINQEAVCTAHLTMRFVFQYCTCLTWAAKTTRVSN